MTYQKGRDRIRILPKYYFVVSGTALSPISPLNAFDEALKVAGIHDVNLVEVSSILPRGVIHLELSREEVTAFFEPGEIVFTVQACGMGRGGEYVSAGLMWGESLETNGVVFEHSSSIPSPEAGLRTEDLRKEIVETLRSKFREGVRTRGIRTREPEFKTAELLVPKGMYGCVLVSLILC
ncbi:MAG: pyruvoyl-dependent arginine decarboxylase [Candidatus Bathyarchaeia archaeon]